MYKLFKVGLVAGTLPTNKVKGQPAVCVGSGLTKEDMRKLKTRLIGNLSRKAALFFNTHFIYRSYTYEHKEI